MKNHLAGTHIQVKPCSQVPEDVKMKFQELLVAKKVNKEDDDDDDMVDIFKQQDVNPNTGKIDSFLSKGKKGSGSNSKQRTLNEVVKDREKLVGDYGRGLKPPTYHEARVSYLKREVDLVEEKLGKYKNEWKKNGCTLMSDGWTDGKGGSLTSFLVNSPSGTVFLKSIDTSKFIKNAQKMFELLDSVVEEIGEEHVVQVVTDGVSNYVAAGKMLKEKRRKLFWSPCAAHCLDLILEDIGKITVFYDTIAKAKQVTSFIYRHTWVLNLYRKFSKDKELARPVVTRFATSFLILSCIMDSKLALTSMFASEEWANSTYATTIKGKKVVDIILSDTRFWKSIQFALKCVDPLVEVLRLVDGDAKPAIGYIYEAMRRAKNQIAKNFNNVEHRYREIWKIIDTRWDFQLHRPLHATTYYLNPKYHYDPNFNPDKEVKIGLYKVIEKMYPDVETRVELDAQLDKFKRGVGLFGMDMAIITRDKKQPALWWDSYGEECKELQTLAIKVLSLTCSATGCERNWSTFEHVHSKRRNHLEQQRLNALVFVKYNLQLEMRQKLREEKGEAYDPICLLDIESDDEWIMEKEDPCLPDDNSWMDVQECFNIDEGAPSNKRARGPRNLNASNKKAKEKVVEEENVLPILCDEDEESEEEDLLAILHDNNNTSGGFEQDPLF
ncbi:uncharacterized protein LOC116143083 [Pistacia vera]|uniref:uncharacterized protein LOC116143083 n=1 Tax=Pistacia vera TaxID=55513 RepID=UPI0012636D5A|nr:uncharacterized protein LOC116143083 [Pistacia vera]